MTRPDTPSTDGTDRGDKDDWDAWVDSTEAKQPIRQQPRACGTEPHL